MLGGVTARFECIVQCDPYPYIEWYKCDTEQPLRSGYGKYFIEFRNGVCRLTIPDAISSITRNIVEMNGQLPLLINEIDKNICR